MRRWFELGENADTTYTAEGGDRLFLQLPQKAEFIAWANSMVGKIVTIFNNQGDSGLCNNGAATTPHTFIPTPPCAVLSAYGELRGHVMFQGVPPSGQGLCRLYFDKPGINDGPNESQTVEKPRGGSSKGGGTLKISLLSYLLLLLQTWQGVPSGTGGKFIPGTGGVPQRWLDWLTTLINHYGRYTPTQIYGFLARVDFSGPTFKV